VWLFILVFCVYVVNSLVVRQFLRPACLLWEIRHMRDRSLRRCNFVKSYRLLLLLGRVNWNVGILVWTARYFWMWIRVSHRVSPACIGSLRPYSWLGGALSDFSAVLSRRSCRFWHGLGLLGCLVLIKEFSVKVVDVAEGIDFGLLLRLVLGRILTTGTHQVCKRSSIWVLFRVFHCSGLWCLVTWLLPSRNSKSVGLMLHVQLLKLSKLFSQERQVLIQKPLTAVVCWLLVRCSEDFDILQELNKLFVLCKSGNRLAALHFYSTLSRFWVLLDFDYRPALRLRVVLIVLSKSLRIHVLLVEDSVCAFVNNVSLCLLKI